MGNLGRIDYQLSLGIHSLLGKHRESKWWKILEFSGSQTGYPLIVLFQFLFLVGWRSILVQTMQVIVITLIMMTVKPVVARKRPDSPTPKEVSHYYDNFSFPSGHATRAGVIVAVSILTTNFWLVLLLWGVFVSLSRVAVLHHYLGDVIAGFLAGLIFSLLTFNIIPN